MNSKILSALSFDPGILIIAMFVLMVVLFVYVLTLQKKQALLDKKYRSMMRGGKGARTLDEALEKRELIKVSVLKNCIDDPREIASVIGERTHSEVIKVIGKKMIFFRQAKKNSKFNLPD